jgi:glycogen synthase
MPYDVRPGTYLTVVGRISPEKGIVEAVELAARSGIPLRIAAKVHRPDEHELFDTLVKPAIDAGTVEFLGELHAGLRDPLLAGAMATLMLGSWPEPFGLVAIESLATGTPVIARHAGALPEIIEQGVDGFLVDDVAEAELALQRVTQLDRALIRERALARFSTERMTTEYEEVYERVLAERRTSGSARRAGLRETQPMIETGDVARLWMDGDSRPDDNGMTSPSDVRSREARGGRTTDTHGTVAGADGRSPTTIDHRP